MAEIVGTLLWVQMGSAIWLAFILLFVYLRFYREPSLRFWSLSFAVQALLLVWRMAAQPSSGEVLSWPPYLLGTLQLSLIALAAIGLRQPVPSPRRQTFLLAGMVAGALVLCLATRGIAAGPGELVRVLRFERQLEGAAASAWFSIAFWRGHRLARTAGGRATFVFTALYAVRHVALAIAILALPAYPGWYPVTVAATGAILPFGVAAGMILLASEAMIATTRSLRDSEERYRTLVEASPDGIVATDPEGTIVMCNRGAAELFGHASPAGMIGLPAPALIAPADRERVGGEIGPAIAEGRAVHLECQILHGESERSAEMTAAPCAWAMDQSPELWPSCTISPPAKRRIGLCAGNASSPRM